MKATLYLIPVPISDNPSRQVHSDEVTVVMKKIDVFIVENVNTARKHLRRAGIESDHDKPEFLVLDEHTPSGDLNALLNPLMEGRDVGLMSEAGMPAIADPGEELILLAHRAGCRVIPLAGPSSIIMALAASGLNGQNFAFNGYLPIKKTDRIKAIRKLEEKVYREKQTQIFMETPYRNMAMLGDLMQSCRRHTLLCIATNISGGKEQILTKTIGEWKASLPDIHKKPSIFILGLSH
ncbi:MAG: hypothetical protein AMS27_05460 [Bacteroides sp. SM23_62_1]|nr:MAG: hypothetical protein AMS27_05460 [Bacteroides sp. SM23_62_1]